jgi:hypothetical protein
MNHLKKNFLEKFNLAMRILLPWFVEKMIRKFLFSLNLLKLDYLKINENGILK